MREMGFMPRRATRNSQGRRGCPDGSAGRRRAGRSCPVRPRRRGRNGGADRTAVHRDALAVALHLQLLEIGGKAAEPLVIGQDGAGGMAADLVVPDADEGQHHGQVRVKRRGLEMAGPSPGPRRGRRGNPRAHGDHERKADRPPHGIAPAHPILEAEDAEGSMPKAAVLSAAVETAANCAPGWRPWPPSRPARFRRWSSSRWW
jgi:hypothetical protein